MTRAAPACTPLAPRTGLLRWTRPIGTTSLSVVPMGRRSLLAAVTWDLLGEEPKLS